MEQPTIRVDLRRTDGKRSTKAWADVTFVTAIGEITVKDFRVMERESDKQLWVGEPRVSYQKNGKTEWKPVFEARQAILRQIGEAVLAEYARGGGGA